MNWIFLCDLLFLTVLFVCALCDLRSRRIPDLFCMCIIAPVLWKTLVTHLYMEAAAGAAAALLITGIPYVLKHSLGGGDVKLTTAAGLYLGIKHTLAMLCFSFLLCAGTACILMLLIRKKVKTMPLAPFIFAGTIPLVLSGYLP